MKCQAKNGKKIIFFRAKLQERRTLGSVEREFSTLFTKKYPEMSQNVHVYVS